MAVEATSRLRADEVQQDALLGTQLGDYHVLTRLGSGGFGTVYRARDVHLCRDVAIKLIDGPFDPDALKAFSEEAQVLAAAGNHPNVVQIYRWGMHEGRPYFVMEYLHESLLELLNRHPEGLSWKEVVRIALAAAAALAHLHQHGLVHRDVKPHNILLDEKAEVVKLTDFGLASPHWILRNGDLAGSPPYMAPELFKNGIADERADVFALGMTMIRTLLGPAPPQRKQGADSSSVMLCELAQRRPDVPKPLSRLIARMLNERPEERIASASLLVRELQRLLPAEGHRHVAITRVAAAALLLVGFLAFFSMRGGAYWPGERDTQAAMVIPLMQAAEADLRLHVYERAAETYSKVLEASPDLDDAQYGLGFAFLGMGEWDRARNAFAAIEDAGRRIEGVAAVVKEQLGEAARPDLAKLAAHGDAPYVQVLLAALDADKGAATAVIKRLESLDDEALRSDWQRGHYRQLLMRAYVHDGRFDRAEALFKQAKDSGASSAELSIVQALAQMASSARNDGESLSGRLERIRENRKTSLENPESAQDLWTSRPLHFCVLLGDLGADGRPQAEHAGTVFPWFFGEALAELAPIEPVDRALLDEVLREYELVSALNRPADQLLLGRLLGADILVQASFATYADNDLLHLQVVNTATTHQYPVAVMPWTAGESLEALAQEGAKQTWNVIQAKLPVRGLVKVEGGSPQLNVGRDVGVEAGQIFVPVSDPQHQIPLPDKSVEVLGPVQGDQAPVELHGFSAEAVPADGLYVICQGRD